VEWAVSWQIAALLRLQQGTRAADDLSLKYVIVFMECRTKPIAHVRVEASELHTATG
jgi:hypothetical protein